MTFFRQATMIVALAALAVLAADTSSFGFWTKKKTAAETASENQKKAIDAYNSGVGRIEKAQTALARGDSTYAYNYRAASDQKARGEYKAAVKDFNKAVGYDSTMADAYNDLGFCYRMLGDFDASLAAYDKAIKLNKDFAQAREYRGETYLAMGKPELAQNELTYLRELKSPLADTLARSIDLYQLQVSQKPARK